jgi:hypothetical protein
MVKPTERTNHHGEVLDAIVQMFKDETSRDSLATFTCASCAECVQLAQRKIENWPHLNDQSRAANGGKIIMIMIQLGSNRSGLCRADAAFRLIT